MTRPALHSHVKGYSVFLNLVLLTLCSITLAGFYADNGIDQTVIYRSLPKADKREMQQEILNLLGLHHRPKPKSHETKNSAPRYLMDLYQSFLDKEDGDIKFDEKMSNIGEFAADKQSLRVINDSDVIMSFVNHIHHHSPHLRHDRNRRFWFDVSEVSPEENIMKAELQIYRDLRGNTRPLNSTYSLKLFVLKHGEQIENIILQLVDNKTIQGNTDGWLVFNVTDPMMTWIAFPHENLGLVLQIKAMDDEHEIHPQDIGVVGAAGEEDHQPFMVGFFKTPSKVHTRTRRARATKKKTRSDVSYPYDSDERIPYLNGRPDSRKNSCQKRTLYVSFKDLGWQDWIIAPDGYAAFYCNGECSFPLNMNATNHAIVQTLVHLVNPQLAPKPCCAPTKLSPIMVLYFDDNSNVILKKYKNMVVKACGCH